MLAAAVRHHIRKKTPAGIDDHVLKFDGSTSGFQQNLHNNKKKMKLSKINEKKLEFDRKKNNKRQFLQLMFELFEINAKEIEIWL